MFGLIRTSRFDRRLSRFVRLHPNLRRRLGETLALLSEDPADPRLGIHPLTPSMAGLYGVRVTYSYRLIVALDNDAHEITLLDIGSHDDVYRR